MNSEIIHQQFLEAKEQAQLWAKKMYEDNFNGETWSFATEDLLKFDTLREFDINRAWQSIT